jgi:polyferredoxin
MFFGLGLGLIFLSSGVLKPENMQIEGFWFMVFGGVFTSAAIHYFVGKILGPTVFNRGWCGWACWTTGVLDLLPWKKSPGRVPGRWGHIRYVHFAVVLVAVAALVFLGDYGLDRHLGVVLLDSTLETEAVSYGGLLQVPGLRWFLVGNALYFGSGIALAAVLRDNRAFCKYLCPIVGFLKPAASVSLARIGAKNDDCTRCRKCERNCPMDVEIRRYVDEGKKVLSTECILCLTCTAVCPEGVLGVKLGPSVSTADYLRVKSSARKEAS